MIPQTNSPYVLMLDDIINKLINHKSPLPVLAEQEIRGLLRVSSTIFLSQPSLVKVNAPISVCGDIHGQFPDLLRIFGTNGYPSPIRKYLFLGDYVDRGLQGVECMCLLLAYKIKYPDELHLLRGNHESPSLNKVYGFYNECCRKYSPALWKDFVKCFDCMPPAGLISGSIFCVHGGISPHMTHINCIQDIKKPYQIGNGGLVCDLLWSDPSSTIKLFEESRRGVSYIFGKEAVELFCKANDLELIVRAHEIVQDGYRFSFDMKLITIFSAPNYCNKFSNAGGVLSINQNLLCTILTIPPIIPKKPERVSVVSPQWRDKIEKEEWSEDSCWVGPQRKTKKILKKSWLNNIKLILRRHRQRAQSMDAQKQHSDSEMDIEEEQLSQFEDDDDL